MVISHRQKKLIYLLLHHESPMHTSELIVHFGISPRTLRQDISSINAIFQSNNLLIHSKSSMGYWIEEEDKALFAMFIKKEKEEMIPANVEQRLISICFYLLEHDEYTSMGLLAELFYVSKTTISNDLKSIQTLLVSIEGLTLSISNQKGIALIGSELAKRTLYSSIILLFYESEGSFLNGYIQKKYDTLHVFHDVNQILMKYYSQLTIFLTDKSLCILTNEVLYSMYRIRFLAKTLEAVELKERDVFPILQVEELFQLQVSQTEKNYFTMLAKKKRRYKEHKVYTNKGSQQYETIVSKFYETLWERFALDFSNEQKLTEHLYAMLAYHSNVVQSDAFILHRMKEAHPFALTLARCIEPILQDCMGKQVSELEVCSLAARLAVILDREMAPLQVLVLTNQSTSLTELIEAQLHQYFHGVMEIVEVCPFYKVSMKGFVKTVDFIIATSSEPLNLTKDIIYVNAVMNSKDIGTLVSYVATQKPSYRGIQKK